MLVTSHELLPVDGWGSGAIAGVSGRERHCLRCSYVVLRSRPWSSALSLSDYGGLVVHMLCRFRKEMEVFGELQTGLGELSGRGVWSLRPRSRGMGQQSEN